MLYTDLRKIVRCNFQETTLKGKNQQKFVRSLKATYQQTRHYIFDVFIFNQLPKLFLLRRQVWHQVLQEEDDFFMIIFSFKTCIPLEQVVQVEQDVRNKEHNEKQYCVIDDRFTHF